MGANLADSHEESSTRVASVAYARNKGSSILTGSISKERFKSDGLPIVGGRSATLVDEM